MRPIELIVTYLAIAAPFGVAHFTRNCSAQPARSRALARAIAAALVWPAGAVGLLFKRGADIERGESAEKLRGRGEGSVERAKRSLAATLMRAEELCEAALGGKSERARHRVFAARAAVERHAGLSLAASEIEDEAGGGRPSARETELCRLAGRAGDDLLIAGRCVHRRNVTRLRVHGERAREEALGALASVRELMDELPHSTRSDALALRELSETLLRACAQAVELFSSLDDRAAVLGAARLLDAECARLRRLEDLLLEEEARRAARAPEGEPCTTRAELTAYATDAVLTGGTRASA